MEIISEDVAHKFCETCAWAHESWIMRKQLFDENVDRDNNIGKVKGFANRLSTITQEYSILQITKLHDPAIQGKSINLTIDYMIKFGNWGETYDHMQEMQKKLSALYNALKPARDKILAHNDLDAFLKNETLGDFSEDLDAEYFKTLQQLVNAVSAKWLGQELYPFNDLVVADVKEFLHVLGKNE